MSEDLFKGLGVEVTFEKPDDFLLIKETLTRIGVASKKEKRLYPSTYILHKQGKYRIFHFKEMFLLDGKTADFTEQDKGRRNVIVQLLQQWNLLKVIDPIEVAAPVVPMSTIKVISFKEKDGWEINHKYSIGRSKK